MPLTPRKDLEKTTHTTTKSWMNWCYLLIALPLLFGCEDMTIWENYSRTERVEPELIVKPNNLQELMLTISQAADNEKRIRMTGSGHSTSDIAVTKEIMLNPTGLTDTLSVDADRLKNSVVLDLVRVESGITIRNLNSYLSGRGLALFNMGGYDGQTIAGVAMTATHGSGLDYGPIVSQVVSLQFVNQYGELVQLEPTNGITDPAKFPGSLEENSDIAMTLIQDDDTFNAFKVSLGSMGIVYSVTLHADKKFWIEEERFMSTWSEVKAPGGFIHRIQNRLPINDEGPQPDYYEMQINPYQVNGENSVLITKRYKSYTPLTADLSRGQPSNYLSGLITKFEQPIVKILETFPGLATTVVEEALKAQVDASYKNVSYKVFNIGIINQADVVGIEMAFDLNQTIAAIDRALEITADLRSDRIVLSAPVALRFVKSSDALIATQYGHDTTFMELIVFQNIYGYDQLFPNYLNTMVNEFDARPHWGLDVNTFKNTNKLIQLYPRWNDWQSIYEDFNSTGIFDGKVTDRLQISMNP